MSSWSQSESTIADNLGKSILAKVVRQQHSLVNAGTLFIQKEFQQFPKPPIFSGTSQSQSSADLSIGTLSILLTMTIKTDYSKYFVKGLGSNKKYGARDPMKPAMKSMVDGIFNIMRG